MVLNITQNHIALDSRHVEYIKKRIAGVIEKFQRIAREPTLTVEVEVGKPSGHHHKGLIYYAEVTVRLKGKGIRAQHKGENLEAAVDSVRDKLYRRLSDYHDKVMKHKA